MRIDGKVVLITGASEGIGAACAAEFARAGAKLSLTARSEEGLRRACPNGPGPNALIIPADLTNEADRRRVVERTVETYGHIDILINNAGVGVYWPSWNIPMEEARYLMELNFFALLGLTQLAVPHMRARKSGMVVNVGSIGGKMTLPWLTIYSASKYAVGALTEGMRMELMRDGIRTLLVCPGYVLTGFQKNVRAGQAPAKVREGRRFAITPQRCATDIRRGVERDARTIVTPRTGWLLVLAMRLFPSIVEARMAEMNGTA
ncbi:MAG TPA: SDR family NAD(P)-dependent oxidoreductase [Candidatus Solibacter sp.]|nr:SDR family NAD(P)-dependent oxidoreductase [Candidatus Solibacter sp.]